MACRNCDGSGMVVGERIIHHEKYGETTVVEAYRCRCAAGMARSQRIPFEPRPELLQLNADLPRGDR